MREYDGQTPEHTLLRQISFLPMRARAIHKHSSRGTLYTPKEAKWADFLCQKVTTFSYSNSRKQNNGTVEICCHSPPHCFPHWLTWPLFPHSRLIPSQVSYRSSSRVCRTSLKESASRLLISSFRYRMMKGIVLSSLKRRIMLAQTQSSIFVLSDKTCKLRILSGLKSWNLNIYIIMYGLNTESNNVLQSLRNTCGGLKKYIYVLTIIK